MVPSVYHGKTSETKLRGIDEAEFFERGGMGGVPAAHSRDSSIGQGPEGHTLEIMTEIILRFFTPKDAGPGVGFVVTTGGGPGINQVFKQAVHCELGAELRTWVILFLSLQL